MGMPVVRYIAWVGASLLALLFIADWYLPKSLPEPTGDPIDRPIIRIASVQQPPERIVFDTGQPTMVPPPTLVGPTIPDEPSPQQSYASAPPPPIIVDVEKKARKVIKRQGPKAAANQSAIDEHSGGCEWQPGEDRSADPIVLHGYRFRSVGEKPIQPALSLALSTSCP
jgi:hypothetical protein